jgi:hypothetical protein
MTTPRDKIRFTLTLEGERGNETAHTHALRRVLKVLLRSCDLRCIDAREVVADKEEPHS